MYQARRSEKITDTLQLIDKDGNVAHELKIVIDVNAISEGFRKALERMREAERQLKESQRKGDEGAFSKAYENYGNALLTMFVITFGANNAKIISDFYEGNYIEMSVEITPYIIDTMIPLIYGAINRRKKQLQNASRRHWNK